MTPPHMSGDQYGGVSYARLCDRGTQEAEIPPGGVTPGDIVSGGPAPVRYVPGGDAGGT